MSSQTVTIVPVQNRRQEKAFLELPWDLHRDDPNWVPPLRLNQKESVNFKPHPFYENARVQTFIAERGGTVVGRIAAIVDEAHNEFYSEKRGMFGFFESVDDQNVAHGLLDAACRFHREQGMDAIRGPMNPSQNYECGLLIDGFDSMPTFGTTYNPKYYQTLIESYGFQKAQDLFAFWGDVAMHENMDKKVTFIVDEAVRRFNIKTRTLDPKHFQRDVEIFLDIYNQSLPGQWGFVPLSRSELRHIAAGLKHLIVPELTSYAEIDGKVVGVVYGLLDYNPIIKAIDGRLFPFGFLRLKFGKKKIKKLRLISTNVIPQYQRWGIGVVMMRAIMPQIYHWGIEEGEYSWVLESNKLSRGTLERGGAKRVKTYRIFDYEL